MVESFLSENVWAAVLLWVVAFVSDYRLTIRAAALRKGVASEYITIRGSYELNPFFQADVDALKPFSRRALLVAFVGSSVIMIVWFISRGGPIFVLCVGALVLNNVTQAIRHLGSISELRLLSRGDVFAGHLEYPRWYSYRQAGVATMLFGLLYAASALLGGSLFLLGGAIGTGIAGLKLFQRANTPAVASQTVTMTGLAVLPDELSAAAGWYPDPVKRHGQRYWNGAEWTVHVTDMSVDPL